MMNPTLMRCTLILQLFDSRNRQIGESSLLSIVVDDLMFNPESRVPDEFSFVLKFSGMCKDWPSTIIADGRVYVFNGQDALRRDWADSYCGAATYVRSKEPTFRMDHLFFERSVEVFTPTTAPDWLTSKNTVRGSTMDNRWFWTDHVLALAVGECVSTDFRRIFRVQ